MTKTELREMIEDYIDSHERVDVIMYAVEVYSSASNGSKPYVSGSLLSEENLERCANLYAEQENSAYTNDYYGYYNGAKQMGNAILNEIQRRQLLIKSEPDGIIRETMINNLLLDI